MSGANNSQPDGQPSGTIEITTSDQGAITNNEETPITSAGPPAGYCYGIFKRHMRYDPLMIVFTILIFVGGIIGYLTKGSTASLVSGTIFTLLLAASTFLEGSRKNPYPLLVTLLALAGMMGYRYYQSMVFMPGGLIALVAFLMAARHFYLLYLRRSTA